jgi:hypothetical protein
MVEARCRISGGGRQWRLRHVILFASKHWKVAGAGSPDGFATAGRRAIPDASSTTRRCVRIVRQRPLQQNAYPVELVKIPLLPVALNYLPFKERFQVPVEHHPVASKP